MKYFKIIHSKISNQVIMTAAAINVFFMIYPAYANGLDKAKGVLEKLRDGLKAIIPIAATVILLCLAVSYAGRFIEKSTFIRWAIGVIIAGSAAEIANMLFKYP
ncbi:VirB2 family type IV secretion system major pilin TrwL [Bartonella sp. CB169]|uniref:VirB2 family type IV secretion system major pilin TrwL n=1 Tax=Bartonella sp. CB169 TaxID=3112257 RepID=UPI00300DFCDD